MLWFRCDEIIGGTSLGIAFIAVALGGYFFYNDVQPFADVEQFCRMAEGGELEDNREAFRQKQHTALILGHTGETGKILARMLAQEKLFSKVTLIGRREVELDKNVFGPEFEQKVIDFEKLNDYVDTFKGHDVGFWCLGTTRGKAGVEGFRRVDYDYVLKTAELAKAGGMKHIQFMSTHGANHNSSALYIGTKGLVEEALKVMHFEKLSIFRPAILMVDRQESRPMEAFARFILIPVAKFFPTAITVPVEYVAKAMINVAVSPSEEKIHIFENREIHAVSGSKRLCNEESKTK